MRFLPALVLAAACFVAPAAAQTQSNPVMEHYRAYRAALESGNLAVAATEAEQALAASEARDGDGGRTAVLALNLASARLMARDAAGAVGPAQRALALAQGGAAGVNATLAGLIVGRAELATVGRPGADRLKDLLSASLEGIPPNETFPAAAELGAWALAQRDFVTARTAWPIAAANAAGAQYGEVHGFAISRTGEGMAIFLEEIGDGERGHLVNVANAGRAHALFVEAARALRPLVWSSAEEPTIAERAYAEALAWQAIVRAKLLSDDQRLPPVADLEEEEELGPTDLTDQQCAVRVVRRPQIRYPPASVNDWHIGAIVLRLRFNDSGAITRYDVLAHLGDDRFVRAVERVVPRWRVVRGESSLPNCRMSGSIFQTINFAID